MAYLPLPRSWSPALVGWFIRVGPSLCVRACSKPRRGAGGGPEILEIGFLRGSVHVGGVWVGAARNGRVLPKLGVFLAFLVHRVSRTSWRGGSSGVSPVSPK